MSGDSQTSSSEVSATIVDDVFCPVCGYNLRGLPEPRCPECGGQFDVSELVVSRIPWADRKRIGRFRAYWQTIWLIMHHNQQFCREIDRPVSYRDSQRFRWITLLHMYFPLLGLTFAYYVLGERGLMVVLGDAWQTVGLHLAFILSAAVATGLPSYFFHPRHLPVEKQNRAVALSYYACAPMALSPLLLAVGWIIYEIEGDEINTVNSVIFLGAHLIMLGIWWLSLILIARRSLHRKLGGMVLITVVMPILWILAAGLTCEGVNTAANFLGIMYYSLQN
ncbi:MAG: hypothetical protein JSV03_14630 [Planctomycetota bacterium]|nr:MAG: hypothetical protein JSV03_14630 [Planctomycetota bacterium]